MITHYIGRPDSNEGRSEVETRTYDFLDLLGIQYETVCHEAAFTMEQCQEIEKTLGVRSARTCSSATASRLSSIF